MKIDPDQKDPNAYWAAFNKRRHQALSRFVRDRVALAEEAARVAPGDTAETRACKLYVFNSPQLGV